MVRSFLATEPRVDPRAPKARPATGQAPRRPPPDSPARRGGGGRARVPARARAAGRGRRCAPGSARQRRRRRRPRVATRPAHAPPRPARDTRTDQRETAARRTARRQSRAPGARSQRAPLPRLTCRQRDQSGARRAGNRATPRLRATAGSPISAKRHSPGRSAVWSRRARAGPAIRVGSAPPEAPREGARNDIPRQSRALSRSPSRRHRPRKHQSASGKWCRWPRRARSRSRRAPSSEAHGRAPASHRRDRAASCVDAESGQFAVQRRRVDAQHFGGPRLVALLTL